MLFDTPEIIEAVAPTPAQFLNGNYMIQHYSSSDQIVFVLVNGMKVLTQGVLGYSMGLSTFWKRKHQMIVFDAQAVKGTLPGFPAALGTVVVVHEMGHAFGYPHVQNWNGGSPDPSSPVGVVDYYQNPLVDKDFLYSFKIYKDTAPQDTSIKNIPGEPYAWNMGTLMQQYAMNLPLFVTGVSGYNFSYSKITDRYYLLNK
jgi:hypothetical protein